MSENLLDLVLGPLRGETRLHDLQGAGPLAGLMVEAFSQRDAINQPSELRISALSGNAALDTDAMLGQPVTLLTRLAAQSLPQPSRIVYKCVVNGKATYSDHPALAHSASMSSPHVA